MNYSFIRKHVTRPSFALVFVVIVLVAGTIYSNIYQCPFVFDDLLQIEDKVIIRGLANYFSFEAFLKPRPIVDLTFALNYRFGQLTVFGYHLVNVLIHIINGFLVYFLALTIFKQLLSGSAQRFDESSKLKAERSKAKAESSKLKAQSSKVKGNLTRQSSNHPVNFSSSSPPHPFTLSPSQQISFMSLFAALIFIAHPIQTQAVTYTVQRYASLAAMFYMGSVLFYLKARITQLKAQSSKLKGESIKLKAESSKVKAESSKLKAQSSELARRQSGGVGPARNALACEAGGGQGSEGRGAFSFELSAYFALSIICGMLAFLSKQSTASLPIAIILVEYLFIDRTWQGWKKKIVWFTPAFIVFAIFVLYVCGFFSGGHEGRGLLEDVSDLMQETDTVGRWSYLCTQFNVLVIYIRLLFLPIGQNLDYLYPFKTGFFDGYTSLAFLFLAGLVGLAIWNRNRRPIITFGIFWFFITLSVESSIFPIRDALFEHRLYLPMFGFALVASWVVFHVFSKQWFWVISIAVCMVLVFGTATYLRNRVWQNTLCIWSDIVSKAPHNYRGHSNLAGVLAHNGRLDEAIEHCLVSLRMKPDSVRAHYNLGYALAGQGKWTEAAEHFSTTLRLNPKYSKAHTNLGVILARKGNLEKAIRHFHQALKIDPQSAKVHFNLGVAYSRQGDLKRARNEFLATLRIQPNHAGARRSLSIVSRGFQKERMDPRY